MDRSSPVYLFSSRLKCHGDGEKGSAKDYEEHEADQHGAPAPPLASLARGGAGLVVRRRRRRHGEAPGGLAALPSPKVVEGDRLV